jgi:hypothetical protein
MIRQRGEVKWWAQ